MKLFNEKQESAYLSKDQWAKLLVAFSILVILLYVGAMIASLCGSKYFILNYQNNQMDKIESFMRSHQIYSLITYVFSVIEFFIVLSFILNKPARALYSIIFYGFAVLFALRFAPRVSIPSGLAADTPVVLSIGGVNYAIKDKYAEDVVYFELPKDRINDVYFSPRFAIVGGVGSSTSEETTSYYFVAWNIPVF